ncbi:MAG: sigma-70 family RNA polymerase sigma factor [Candidatus Omnitrophica bacterium]|nr:sigma-70 family RNA polymerase sigma factor [Candidatus Omnitrophota bacterium]MCA9444927.1 sigma-70 family RNA polymerase sigma factor [Candidatus Omnitrophota bacterium]
MAILPDRPPTQFRSVEKKTENQAVKTALLALSSKQRQAVVLRFFEELPFAEIARAMGCRETSVRTHLKRAIRTLERALADQIHFEDREI